MLVYVESRAFLGRTFVVACQSHDTAARLKAHLLHVLHDWGRANHQFRLRYKSKFLQDAVSIEAQGLVENGVLQMVPLAKETEGVQTVQQAVNADSDYGHGHSPLVTHALQKEVDTFKRRQSMIKALKALMWLMLLLAALVFASTYWYSGFWSILVVAFGFYYCPSFYRVGGVVSKPNLLHFRFMWIYSVLSLFQAVATLTLWLVLIMKSDNLLDNCRKKSGNVSLASDGCSSRIWFSGITYCIQTMILFSTSLLSFVLIKNLHFQIGDSIEPALLELRDVSHALAAARSGLVNDRRSAAAELNAFIGTSDDSKFQVVEENGLPVLIHLSLSQDQATQEFATEALTMLLEIPAIQNEFVRADGVTCLSALLRSDIASVEHDASRGLAMIVEQNVDNGEDLTKGNSLADLAYALEHGSLSTKCAVAGIIQLLSIRPDLRAQIARNKLCFHLLVESFCKSDEDTLRGLSLQALELLVLERPDLLATEEDLVKELLAAPHSSSSLSVLGPVSKMLQCYADDHTLASELCDVLAELRATLDLLVSTRSLPILHNCLETIIALLQNTEYREKVVLLDFLQVIARIQNVQAADENNVDVTNLRARADRIATMFQLQASGLESHSLPRNVSHASLPTRRIRLAEQSRSSSLLLTKTLSGGHLSLPG